MIFLIKGFVVPAVEGVADLFHEVVVEPQIVLDRKAHADGFLGADQMADVGAAVQAAGGAAAVRVDRARVGHVLLVHQIDLAESGV